MKEAKIKFTTLAFEYVKKPERQNLAKRLNCDFVLSIHFNSASNPQADYSLAIYNKPQAKQAAKELAELCATLFTYPKNHKVVNVREWNRASFISKYEMPCVLLEICFISNSQSALFLHGNQRAVAKMVAAKLLELAIKNHWSVVGIDPGHLHRGYPDPGARCVMGDTEAQHVESFVEMLYDGLEELSRQGDVKIVLEF